MAENNIIPPQLIITEFQVKGEADIKRMKDLQASLDKKTVVNVDTDKAQKAVFDLGASVEKLSEKQLASLKTNFSQLGSSLTPLATALKNLPSDQLKKLDVLLEGTTDEFKALGIQVKFMKDNLDKLKLNPTEVKNLTKSLEIADQVVNEFGKDIEAVGTKNVSLRGKLAAVRNELTLLDQAGNSGTQAYKDLQVQAGKLQDEIDDNRAAVKALSSDTLKLDAGIGAVRGLVAAFTAYQGVLGLLGVENKDFEKTLLKINGAMAILQGLQEITNLLQAQSAVRLVASAAAQSLWNSSIAGSNTLLGLMGIEITGVTGALVTFRNALAATGIGLLITAIGYLGTTAYNTYQDIQKLKNGLKEFEDAAEIAGKALIKRQQTEENTQKLIKGGLNDKQRELDLLKAKNASLEVINRKEVELTKLQIAANDKRIAELSTKELLFSESARIELQKRYDDNRDNISKLRVLEATYIEERIAMNISLQQRLLATQLDNNGIFGRDLAKKIEIARLSYQKDLNEYKGTEDEKRKFRLIRESELNREILKITRDFDKELASLTSKSGLREEEIKKLNEQAQKTAAGIVDNTKIGFAYKTQEARQAYIDMLVKVIQGSVTEDIIRKKQNKEAIDLVKGLGISIDKAYTDRIAKTKTFTDAEKQINEVRISLLTNQFEKERQLNQIKHDEDIKRFIEQTDNVDQQEEYIKQKDAELKKLNAGESILSRLFGFNKEQEAAANEAFKQSLDLLTQLADAKIAQDDREIASQEDKIARFRELAEFGTAEQLQLETDRLDKLKQAREEDAKHQKEIAAIQIATSNAVTIAKGIEAIINGFKDDPVSGVLNAIALAATVASTIITLNNAFGSLPAYAEGESRLQGAGTSKSDSIVARVSRDEAILTAEQNRAMGFDTNENKVKYYLLGRQMADNMPLLPDFSSSLPSGSIIKDDRETKELLRELLTETKRAGKTRINVVQKLTNEGIVQAVETVERRRKRLER